MLRIHDILVWIRIRIWIRGSMSLTNASDPDPAIFVLDLHVPWIRIRKSGLLVNRVGTGAKINLFDPQHCFLVYIT
jgi:hypothetical protein